MGYIYLITNKINGKKYIGQTRCYDINKRWRHHKTKDRYTIGKYLLAAYNKYGLINFKFQIICICFDEDVNKYEIEYIKKYNSFAPNGYNLTKGGECQRKIKTKNISTNYPKRKKGDPMTEEQKEKISKAMTGKKRGPMTEETKKKCIPYLKKSLENRKKVGKYNNNNELLEEFNSISEASKKTKISRTSISKTCLGNKRYKTAGGFIWKYI